jgi:hypothetical protein
VEIHTDVDVVFAPKGDGLIQIGKGGFVDLRPIAIFDPDAVVHRQADKIKAPFRDEFEVVLFVWAGRGIAFVKFSRRLKPRQMGAFREQVRAIGRRKCGGQSAYHQHGSNFKFIHHRFTSLSRSILPVCHC